MNAVGLYLNFDADKLQLTNLDTSQSFCQFYPEKRFDNNLGTISLTCGAPHPGVSDKNTLLELEFIALDQGTTNLLVNPDSKILLSNGKGTNILDEEPVDPYTISIRNTL